MDTKIKILRNIDQQAGKLLDRYPDRMAVIRLDVGDNQSVAALGEQVAALSGKSRKLKKKPDPLSTFGVLRGFDAS